MNDTQMISQLEERIDLLERHHREHHERDNAAQARIDELLAAAVTAKNKNKQLHLLVAEVMGERDAAREHVTNQDHEICRLNEFFTTSASLRALRERDDVIADLGLQLANAQRTVGLLRARLLDTT